MISLYKTAVSEIVVGGQAATAMYGPVAGGIITNPAHTVDQGIAVLEPLYIDITAPASLGETITTMPLQPGQTFVVPPGITTNVSVNAKTAGHKFFGIVYQPQTPYPPTPQTGTFPPSGPTTLTGLGGMASYLYWQYADDDDLQAFVNAYNGLADSYVSWFATIGLPVYISTNITGALLDWVAQGIYGMERPALSSGRSIVIGPVNTFTPNKLPPNVRRNIGPSNVTVTSDDVFKRIMTWNFYKGDGNIFNTRWLKRRIMRFLIGLNGTAPNIDYTPNISVTYGGGNVAIRITVGTRSITGGALPNRIGCNRLTPNALNTVFNPAPMQYPLESVLQEALLSGALQLPFQYQFSIAI